MTTLLLKFFLNLETDKSDAFGNHGPLFHRWLPDGEKDAIVIQNSDPNALLKIWFERRGIVDGTQICYRRDRHEIDPNVMSTHGVLDAGSLIGLLKLREISEEEEIAIKQNLAGNDNYMALGKRILKSYLYPSLQKFFYIIRINYGQYWIRPIDAWDSREISLGGYFRHRLQAIWSLDGEAWSQFTPNDPIQHLNATITPDHSFFEYLTEDDWRELSKHLRIEYETSLAALILRRAHQLLDQGSVKYALVEGTTAMEIAIQEFLRRKTRTSSLIQREIQSFWNLPLSAQIVSITRTLGTVSSEDIEHTIKTVEIRNKIIHEGTEPSVDAGIHLKGLLRLVATLLQGPVFRFPAAHIGNTIQPAEVWDESYQRWKCDR